MPALGDALTAGAVSGAHVDVVGRALRQLEPDLRPRLVGRAGWLVGVATRATPDELQRTLATEVRVIQRDDGLARLERQRRATRLRSWVDGEGMWCLAGRFDPETGLRVHGRLSATVAALFAEQVPEHCPTDPVERQGFLRAHALAALCDGTGPGGGRAEVVVVVDTTNPDPTGVPTVDWGLPGRASPPPCCTSCSTLLTSTPSSSTTASSSTPPDSSTWAAPPGWPTGPNAGPYAPSTRPAPSPAARCDSSCKLHHLWWWEHGGPTDVHNLLPLCVQHHHAIHDRHGSSPSPPTASSPSPTPTAPCNRPDQTAAKTTTTAISHRRLRPPPPGRQRRSHRCDDDRTPGAIDHGTSPRRTALGTHREHTRSSASDAVHLGHRLDVGRVGEQVDQRRALVPVALSLQQGHVPGHGDRIA